MASHPCVTVFDSQRGVVLTFGGDSSAYQTGSFANGTAATLLVGVPSNMLNVLFNGGSQTTTGGDTLRLAGDGQTAGAVFSPSSSQPGTGNLTIANMQFAFTGVEPVIVHGLPNLAVRTADADQANLEVGSTSVSNMELSSVTLHTLVIDGVVSWTQEAKLSIDPVAPTKQFGQATAQDGNFLVVGSKVKDRAAGRVTLYEWTGSSWIERAVLNPNDVKQAGGADFGAAVAISGNTLVVGAPGDNDRGLNAGAVYVFERTADGWIQKAKVTGVLTGSNSRFGTSVGVSGDNIVGGQPGSGTGSDGNELAYFFSRSGSFWFECNRFEFQGDFGRSVSISGNRAVVGRPDYAPAGASARGLVSYFEFDGQNWQWRQDFSPADPQNFERFGDSVSISNNQFVVGAPGWDDMSVPNDPNLTPPDSAKWDHGRAIVFNRESGAWVLEARLSAKGGLPDSEAALEGNEFDHFGASVATNGSYVVVGAPDADSGPSLNSGAAYVYYRQPSAGSGNGATWTRSSGANGPGKLTALKPAGADAGSGAPLADAFGTSVSISDSRIVVGIPGFNETDSLNNILQADVGSINTFTTDNVLPAVTNESLRAEVISGGANTKFGKLTAYEPTTRTLFVAAPNEGRVYLYANEGLSWRPTGFLRPIDNNGEFGVSLAVNGTRAVIGSPGSGRVYIYSYNSATQTWLQSAFLSGSGDFGRDVDIRDNQLVVGAPTFNFGYNTLNNDNTNFMNLSTPGAAFVYALNGSVWSPSRVLVPDDFNLPLSDLQTYSVPITASSNNFTLNAASVILFKDSNYRNSSLVFNSTGGFVSTGSLDDKDSSILVGPYTRVILRDTGTGCCDDKEGDETYENNSASVLAIKQVSNNDDHEEIWVQSIGPTVQYFSRTVGVPNQGGKTSYGGVSNGRWGTQVTFLDSDTIALGAPGQNNVSVYELSQGNNSGFSQTNAFGFTPLRVNARANVSGIGSSVVDAGGSVFAARTPSGIQFYNSFGQGITTAPTGGLNTSDTSALAVRGNVTAVGDPRNSNNRGIANVFNSSRPNSGAPSLQLTPYSVSGSSMVTDNTANRGFGSGVSIVSENFYVVGTDPAIRASMQDCTTSACVVRLGPLAAA
ncbi:MAG: FG-GAP repeat protein [Pirellulales bacterium]